MDTADNRRRIGIGLAGAVGVIAAALASSPLACADASPLASIGPPCGADVCSTEFGPFEPYFPLAFVHEYVPADDYASDGFFYLPPPPSQGFPDATGFDITSGYTDHLAEFQGVAGETVLYTLNNGEVSAPIELLPFELPL